MASIETRVELLEQSRDGTNQKLERVSETVIANDRWISEHKHVKKDIADHKLRIRPLESFSAKVMAFATLGALLGVFLAQVLARMVVR